MGAANTWIVRKKKDDWDSVDYGDIVQALTAAQTPEEARANGAELFNCTANEIEAFPYSLGDDGINEAPAPFPPSVHDE